MNTHKPAPSAAQAIISPSIATKNQPNSTTYALIASGLLLGCAAGITGWTYGLERGGVLGGLTGIAACIGLLVAPRVLVNNLTSGEFSKAILASLLIAISAPFVISGALGNAASVRHAASAIESKTVGDRTRAQTAYDAAKHALATLPPARPVAIVESELAAILKDTRLNDCAGWLANTNLRGVCIKQVEPLRRELLTARERAQQQVTMNAAAATLTAVAPVAQASADAVAIARLAGRFGISTTADMVTDVLLVMQVLLLELGGALCLALIPAPSPAVSVAGNSNVKLLMPMVESPESDLLAKRLEHGPLVGRQRDLAAMFDLPISTFRRRVESNRNVRMTATATSSRLELVA